MMLARRSLQTWTIRAQRSTSVLRVRIRDYSACSEPAIVSKPKPSHQRTATATNTLPRRQDETRKVEVDLIAVGESSPVVSVTEAVGDSKSHRQHQVFHVDASGNFEPEPAPPLSFQVCNFPSFLGC